MTLADATDGGVNVAAGVRPGGDTVQVGLIA